MLALPIRSLDQRTILLTDAVVTGATAILMIAVALPLTNLLDLPIGLIAGAGLFLVPHTAFLVWIARQKVPHPRLIQLVIGANLAWAIGGVALFFTDAVTPNAYGVAFILMHVLAVLVIADLLILTGRSPNR